MDLDKVLIAKDYIKEANEFFDKTEYSMAIEFYKKAILHLVNVEFKKPTMHKGGSRQKLAFDLIRTAWGWMGRAYHELREEEIAMWCYEEEKNCTNKFLELVKKTKEERKKTRSHICFILIQGIILLTFGILCVYFLKFFVLSVNFTIISISLISYVIFFLKLNRLNKRINYHELDRAGYFSLLIIVLTACIFYANYFYYIFTGDFISIKAGRFLNSLIFAYCYIFLITIFLVLNFLA